MRTLNAAATALLARLANGEEIPFVQLVEMMLEPEPLRMTTAGQNIPWNGHTWHRGGLGRIDPIEDGNSELPGLQFAMPGILQDDIALVLTTPVKNKVVNVYDAILDPDTRQVADAYLAWTGTLNVPTLVDGQEAVVSVAAEHLGVRALRPKPRRYNGAEQRKRYPGDTSLDFDPATDGGPLAWPRASYFRK